MSVTGLLYLLPFYISSHSIYSSRLTRIIVFSHIKLVPLYFLSLSTIYLRNCPTACVPRALLIPYSIRLNQLRHSSFSNFFTFPSNVLSPKSPYKYLKNNQVLKDIFFSVAQQPSSALGGLIVDVSTSHITRHIPPVGLL